MAQILFQIIGHFRSQSVGQNGFLVGNVRFPTFNSITGNDYPTSLITGWTVYTEKYKAPMS